MSYDDASDFLTSSFKKLEVIYSSQSYKIDLLQFGSNSWTFQTTANNYYVKPFPYSMAEDMTIRGYAASSFNLDVQANNIQGITFIPYNDIELKVVGNLAAAKVSNSITIDHGSNEVTFISNTPKIDSIVFTGEGKVTIQYSYTAGKDICSCASRDECNDTCKDSMDFVDFENLDSTLKAQNSLAISINIGESSIHDHPIISTNSLKQNNLKFIGLGFEKSFIEFSNESIEDIAGTVTSFEGLSLISNYSAKFGILALNDCDVMIESVEADTVNSSYSSLLKLVTLKCNELSLYGALSTSTNELDIGSSNCYIRIDHNSSVMTIGSNSIDINGLKITTTGDFIISLDKFIEATIESTSELISIPSVSIQNPKEVKLNIKGSFDKVSSGSIKIVSDKDSTFNFYSQINPIEFASSEHATLCAFATIVNISRPATFSYPMNFNYATFTHDGSISSAKINFLDELKITGSSRYSDNIFILKKPSINLCINSMTNLDRVNLRVQYYLNLDGVGSIKVKNMNGNDIYREINFVTDIPSDTSGESIANFLSQSRELFSTESTITEKDVKIKATASNEKPQAHGFTSTGFCLGLNVTDNSIMLFTETDPKNIPITMYYGTACNNEKYEVCLGENQNIDEFAVSWVNSIRITVGKDGRLNLSSETLKNMNIEVKSTSIYTAFTSGLILGSLPYLKLSYMEYYLVNEMIDGDTIGKVVFEGRIASLKTGEINFDFTKIGEIEVTSDNFANLGISSFSNPMTMLITDESPVIKYHSDGWDYAFDTRILAVSFPKTSFKISDSSNSLALQTTASTASILDAPVTIISGSMSINVGTNFEKFENQIRVDTIETAKITSIKSNSFYFPFVFDPNIIPKLNILFDSITLKNQLKLEDWKIKVDFSSGTEKTITGTSLILNGNNVITSIGTDGKITFDSVTVNQDGNSTFPMLTVENVLVLEPGSEFHGTLSAKKIDLHWSTNKFPFIEFYSDSQVIPDEINIIFNGSVSDKIDEFIVGKSFDLIDSKNKKCDDIITKVNLSSSLETLKDTDLDFNIKCSGNILQIEGIKKAKPMTSEIDQPTSVYHEEITSIELQTSVPQHLDEESKQTSELTTEDVSISSEEMNIKAKEAEDSSEESRQNNDITQTNEQEIQSSEDIEQTSEEKIPEKEKVEEASKEVEISSEIKQTTEATTQVIEKATTINEINIQTTEEIKISAENTEDQIITTEIVNKVEDLKLTSEENNQKVVNEPSIDIIPSQESTNPKTKVTDAKDTSQIAKQPTEIITTIEKTTDIIKQSTKEIEQPTPAIEKQTETVKLTMKTTNDIEKVTDDIKKPTSSLKPTTVVIKPTTEEIKKQTPTREKQTEDITNQATKNDIKTETIKLPTELNKEEHDTSSIPKTNMKMESYDINNNEGELNTNKRKDQAGLIAGVVVAVIVVIVIVVVTIALVMKRKKKNLMDSSLSSSDFGKSTKFEKL